MGGLRSAGAGAPLLAVLMLVLVLLGGCAQPSKSGPRDASAPAPPAEFDEDTGGIEGSVVDDELLPIVNAQVGILALDMITTTDLAGMFSFSRVPPGMHEVAVTALGFSSRSRMVEVPAGDVVETEIDLEKLATVEVYKVLQSQRGLFGCGGGTSPGAGLAACGVLGILDDVAGTNTSAYDDFLLYWQLPNSTAGGWNASVFEMVWESNQLTGKGLTMIWEVEGCPNVGAMTFARASGRSPLNANVTGSEINEIIADAVDEDSCDNPSERCNVDACLIYSRVFSQPDTIGQDAPADVGFTFQQSFEQFHTSFYHGPAPPGYSSLA